MLRSTANRATAYYMLISFTMQAKEDCRNKNAALVTIQDGDEHQESLRTLVEDYFETNPDWNFLKVCVCACVRARGLLFRSPNSMLLPG
eukprot:1152292-Pelagomonas_calceolata.AAC.5